VIRNVFYADWATKFIVLCSWWETGWSHVGQGGGPCLNGHWAVPGCRPAIWNFRYALSISQAVKPTFVVFHTLVAHVIHNLYTTVRVKRSKFKVMRSLSHQKEKVVCHVIVENIFIADTPTVFTCRIRILTDCGHFLFTNWAWRRWGDKYRNFVTLFNFLNQLQLRF